MFSKSKNCALSGDLDLVRSRPVVACAVDIDWTSPLAPLPAINGSAKPSGTFARRSKEDDADTAQTSSVTPKPPASKSLPLTSDPQTSAVKTTKKKTKRHASAASAPKLPAILERYVKGLVASENIFDASPLEIARPVDFRRNLALRIADRQRLPRSWRDRRAHRVARFFGILRRCSSEIDLISLDRRFPKLLAAIDLFVKDPPHPRWDVEARILAQQPLEEIDVYMCMPPGTTAWYEKLFFSVLDRISYPGYIAHAAIRLHGNEDDLGALWRHAGYHGGLHVVDALVIGDGTGPKPQSPSEVRNFLAADVDHQLMIKTYIAVHQVKVDRKSALRLLQLHAMSNRSRSPQRKTMIQHELAPSFSENLRVGLDEISKTFGMAHEIDPVESLVGRLPPPFVNLEELSGEATVATRPESIGAWET